MKSPVDLSLMAPEMKRAIQNMAFGEGASSDNDTVAMIINSALSRYLSGKKEFGSNIKDITKKGYYAVINPNDPYKQAISGKFPDVQSRSRYSEIGKLVDAILVDKSYGKDKAQFFFTDEEVEKQKKKGFKFDQVKPKGRVGIYNTYGY